MPEKCVFCGAEGAAFPPEHWVPQWVSRATIPRGKKMVEHHVHDGGRVWYGRIFDLTVGGICPDCNHRWMSDMESQARPIALPLIQGERTAPLTEGEQERLAAWCFLKAITLELGRPAGESRTYPAEVYTGFYRFKEPPSGSVVSNGRRRQLDLSDPRLLYLWFRSEGRKQTLPGVGDVGGYRTALVIGHLVIDVLGVLANVRLNVKDEDTRLVPIWPTRGPTIDLPADSFVGIENDDLV